MKLIITCGVPASGKSTWAINEARQNGNIRLISRDDIRLMLYGSLMIKRYRHENEEVVNKIQEDTARLALSNGKTVIVHDTNLKIVDQNRWKAIAKEFNADFEIRYFDAHIVKLLERNEKRGEKYVPVDRIWTMYRNYRELRGWKPASDLIDINLPKCVIFDVDGTLTTVGQRSPYDFSKAIDDPAVPHIQELFRMYKDRNYKCIIVSGRDDVCKEDTLENLERTGVYPDDIFMRREKDCRPDFDVKEQILRTEIIKKYRPILAVDDRDTPVGMWRMNGIPCLQVNYGNF